ncbi:MAG: glycosyl transferase [Roseiflexus castenholzii]|nr:MAG: glycosyl transferase [Roseiflexus castenholzii]
MTAMHRSERRLLMISYYYAPTENPGTRRVGAFVRYLPQYGYHPTVLTTSSYGTLVDDEQRLIFRAPDAMDVGRWLARRFQRARPATSGARQSPILTPDSPLSRTLEHILIPDIHIGWLPGAVLRGMQVLRAGTFRAIFSSAPPPSAHLTALALKRLSGLPWVADFRDGWTFEPPDPTLLRSVARMRIERALEEAVVRHADQIVTVNQVLADDLKRRFPTTSVTVISNGYEAVDFATLERAPKQDMFEIVYTGRLGGSEHGRSINALMQALSQLQTKSHPLASHWRFILAGSLTNSEHALLEQSGFGEQICCLGDIPHRIALQHQVNATILLLITSPSVTSVTTSKLFEYLASGRPILALTGRSAAAALIEEFNAGIVVAPDDVDGICRALEWFYERWRSNNLPTRVDPRVQRFDRRSLTGDLAKIFDILM